MSDSVTHGRLTKHSRGSTRVTAKQAGYKRKRWQRKRCIAAKLQRLYSIRTGCRASKLSKMSVMSLSG